MKLTPMRYKDYIWPNNPESYRISFRRSVAAHKLPGGTYAMQDLGTAWRVLEGGGGFRAALRPAAAVHKRRRAALPRGGRGRTAHAGRGRARCERGVPRQAVRRAFGGRGDRPDERDAPDCAERGVPRTGRELPERGEGLCALHVALRLGSGERAALELTVGGE